MMKLQEKRLYFFNLEHSSIIKGRGRFEAASKATKDVKDIVLSLPDVKYIPLYRHTDNKIVGIIELLVQLVFRCLFIPRHSIVFIQYPIMNIKAFYIVKNLLRRYEVTTIIHDLQSYRYPQFYADREKELAILNSMKHLIVHTDKMKNLLVKDGVESQIHILGVFDYLLPPSEKVQYEKDAIVFAGALQKSLFLNQMYQIDISPYHINLYGGVKPAIDNMSNMEYKGAFKPDCISAIEGEWGLMWDGDGIDSCTGNFGEYLQLIAPHKFSLYIACGLKIIVWEKSAMAEVVKQHGIGITIASLREIKEKLSKLDNQDIEQMNKNIRKLSDSLRNGMMFKSVISEILQDYN